MRTDFKSKMRSERYAIVRTANKTTLGESAGRIRRAFGCAAVSIFICLVGVCPAAAQTTGVSGPTEIPGFVVKKPPSPDPNDARLIPLSEFQRSDVQARRKLMAGW